MGEFGKRMASQIQDADKQREAARAQADTESSAAAELERHIRKLAPDVWQSFRTAIVAKCDEVNKACGKDYYRCHDEMPNKLHVIRLNPIANLRLEFFPDGSRIHFEAGSCVGDYLVRLDDGTGKAILSDAYPTHTFEIEGTAEYLLEDCLEKARF
jgi:hypothetical protein